jgi:thioredoxin 1
MKQTFTSLRMRECLRGEIGRLLLVLMALAVLSGCQEKSGPAGTEPEGTTSTRVAEVVPAAGDSEETPTIAGERSAAGIPRLLDLGAGKCIPCKMMAPILDELKTEYVGSLEVVFIDVWQEKGAGEKYGIQMIPTQIFYDPSGKELFRHEGFFAKEDILTKWKELGFTLAKKPTVGSAVD